VVGLPIFYTRGAIPRLTSAAALEWGKWAEWGVSELDSQDQVDDYYRGRLQQLKSSQIKLPPTEFKRAQNTMNKPEVRGVCITRYQGVALGLGYLSETVDGYQLKSEYPSKVRLVEGRSAFEPPGP